MNAATAEATRPTARGGAGVVVGVDGSASSIGALQRGARLATALGVPLRAVTAWNHPLICGAGTTRADVPTRRDR